MKTKKGSKKTKKTRAGTAKSLVISMLKEGPQTRDALAEAIIANNLTKITDIKKVKGSVSVMLTSMKKSIAGFERVERGTYRIKE